MKRSLIIALSLLVGLQLTAQTAKVTVKGKLVDEDGLVLPYVTILVKGTGTKTISDTQGEYTISASAGSVLVFYYWGMMPLEMSLNTSTQDMLVTRLPVRKNPDIRADSGYAVLTETSPVYTYTYKHGDWNRFRNLKKLKPIPPFKGRNAIMPEAAYQVIEYSSKSLKYGFEYSTWVEMEEVAKLPAVQNDYAQGQTDGSVLQWYGADAGEIYSWGPAIKDLTFDGSTYDYDKNGRLVSGGSGAPARSYDREGIFRKGFTWGNDFSVGLSKGSGSDYSILLNVNTLERKGVIRNSDFKHQKYSLSLKDLRIADRFSITEARVAYQNSEGDLLPRGANIASVIGSVYTTPPTFDNTNGLSGKQASREMSSYWLPGGTMRSYAPGMVDNPFGLIQELPDNERGQRFYSSLTLKYSPDILYRGDFEIDIKGSLDKQWNDIVNGAPPGFSDYPSGRMTDRREQQTSVNAFISPRYRFDMLDGEADARIAYNMVYDEHSIARKDGNGFTRTTFGNTDNAFSLVFFNEKLYRNSHELKFSLDFRRDWLKVILSDRLYFSNTARHFTNFLPAAYVGLTTNSHPLGIDAIDNFKLELSASRNVHEAPLVYSSYAGLSTAMPASQFSRFYEYSDIFFTGDIKPERDTRFEAGFRTSLLNYRIAFEAWYFNTTTYDFIAPVQGTVPSQYILSNAARVNNHSFKLSASYKPRPYSSKWQVKLNWSKYKNTVKELNGSASYIPLAGFSDIATVLAKDCPVGAIFGTTYQYNNEGKRIIGNDGFPLVDPSLKMIGDPTPSWIGSIEPTVNIKRFSLSMTLEYKHGGDIWNGTKAAMDFLGTSKNSGEQRNTTGYVFDGVNGAGHANTVPVDFYNPTQPLNQNKWVRYGFAGVGEEYIENASWLRLSDLSLSYLIRINKWINSINLTASGRNLFVITPYTGVDPSSALFNYATGKGLDLFNVPGARNYSFKLTVKF